MNLDNKDIRESGSIEEIVSCVKTPIYGESPVELIEFFSNLPLTDFYNYLRTLSVPYFFHLFEKNLFREEDPLIWFPKELNKFMHRTQGVIDSPFKELMKDCLLEVNQDNPDEEVKVHTGIHYGKLFKDFDNKSYFEEARKILELRLQRNNIQIENLENLRLLDQGCGGGRYSAAWKLLGVGSVVGLDYSAIGLDDARHRIELAGIENINFDQGSVLNMPYDNETFDIVFSNGVLHHTEDWQKGISEQLRVLKSGGYGWLYLIEKPGGVFWDKIEILRAIMKNVNKEFAQRILKSLNIPSNRIFYMLDHVMVPINTRLTPAQIENELELNGAISIKRLERGTDFDRVEHIYNKISCAKEKFGVGENRYFFRKK